MDELQMLDEKLERLSIKLDNHIIKQAEDTEKIRVSYHNINENLLKLNNPLVTVHNGEEKEIPQTLAIAELWEATQGLRLLNNIFDYFKNNKFLKWIMILLFIFALLGIMAVPIDAIINLMRNIRL